MKGNLGRIYLLTFISFLLGTSQFVVGGVLDKIADSLMITVAMAGQIVTAFSIGAAIGTPIILMAISKWGKREQLLMALSSIVISTIMTAILPGFTLLVLSRFLFGIGFGVYAVSAYTIIADLAETGKEGRAMANLAVGASAALVVGVPLGRVIASSYSWRFIFIGIAILVFLALIGVMVSFKAVEAVPAIPMKTQLKVLSEKRIVLTLMISVLIFISYSSVNTYITPILMTLLPRLQSSISLILLGIGISSVIGSKVGGHLADHIGPQKTLIFSVAFQGLMLLLVFAFPKSVYLTIPLLFAWASGAWVCGPTLAYNLISIYRESASILLSLNSTFVQIGFALGSIIGGIIMSHLSIDYVILFGTGVAIIALFVTFMSFAKTRYASKIF